MSTEALSHAQLLAITRMPRGQLVARIERWMREHNRRHVIGGPRQWSKDELVSAVVRIERGEEP